MLASHLLLLLPLALLTLKEISFSASLLFKTVPVEFSSGEDLEDVTLAEMSVRSSNHR